MDLNEAAVQIKTALSARGVADDFDRGWNKALDRVVEFLTVDLASEPE